MNTQRAKAEPSAQKDKARQPAESAAGDDSDAVIRHNLPVFGPHGWYVSKVGVYYPPASLTTEEEKVVRTAIGRKKFRLKECFANAVRIVIHDHSNCIQYVEGFLIRENSPSFAIHHGWAVINGKVIDPTNTDGVKVTMAARAGKMPHSKRVVLGTFGADRVYIGVEFPRSELPILHPKLTGDECGPPPDFVRKAYEAATGHDLRDYLYDLSVERGRPVPENSIVYRQHLALLAEKTEAARKLAK